MWLYTHKGAAPRPAFVVGVRGTMLDLVSFGAPPDVIAAMPVELKNQATADTADAVDAFFPAWSWPPRG